MSQVGDDIGSTGSKGEQSGGTKDSTEALGEHGFGSEAREINPRQTEENKCGLTQDQDYDHNLLNHCGCPQAEDVGDVE